MRLTSMFQLVEEQRELWNMTVTFRFAPRRGRARPETTLDASGERPSGDSLREEEGGKSRLVLVDTRNEHEPRRGVPRTRSPKDEESKDEESKDRARSFLISILCGAEPGSRAAVGRLPGAEALGAGEHRGKNGRRAQDSSMLTVVSRSF